MQCFFDGDSGGKAKAKALEKVMHSFDVKSIFVTSGSCLEDIVLCADTLFPRATAAFVAKITGRGGDEVLKALTSNLVPAGSGFAKPPSGWANWSRKEGAKEGGLDNDLSSVGIADAYSGLLLASEPSPKMSVPTGLSKLVKSLVEVLELPSRTLRQDTIVSSEA